MDLKKIMGIKTRVCACLFIANITITFFALTSICVYDTMDSIEKRTKIIFLDFNQKKNYMLDRHYFNKTFCEQH